jgi:hypothetical protein
VIWCLLENTGGESVALIPKVCFAKSLGRGIVLPGLGLLLYRPLQVRIHDGDLWKVQSRILKGTHGACDAFGNTVARTGRARKMTDLSNPNLFGFGKSDFIAGAVPKFDVHDESCAAPLSGASKRLSILE